MKWLKFNYLPILITMTLCLVGPSCRKKNSAGVDSTPTANEEITSRSDEEIVFLAQIVARRTDPIDFTDLDMYYQSVFDMHPECQTILFDQVSNIYIGSTELAGAENNYMIGYNTENGGSNGNMIIMQPNNIILPPCMWLDYLRVKIRLFCC